MKHEVEGLNGFIASLDGGIFSGGDGDPNYNVKGYTEDCGKVVPYIGWYWRSVPFAEGKLTLGCIPDGAVGFMENNKWDYDEWETTEEQRDEIVRLLLAAKAKPSDEAFQAVYDYIQTCKPDKPLMNKEQYKAHENEWHEKFGMGPVVNFPVARTSGDKETDELCPKCKERNLWSSGPHIVVCYCGYQKPDEMEFDDFIKGLCGGGLVG